MNFDSDHSPNPEVTALDPEIYRDMRWCARCAGPELFVEVYEFEGGRLGVCMGCGEERVVGWSRTNSGEAG